MALLDLTTAKAYIRSETTAEDTLLEALLASAAAVVRGYLNRPIEAAERTYTVEDARANALDRWQLTSARRAATYLRVPDTPIDLGQAFTITDADGVTLDTSLYRVDAVTGVLRGVGFGFFRFPYTIVATTGLATRADYDTVVEPAINAAIGDVFADLVQRRNPAATAEHAAGGDSVSYGRIEETIPRRAFDLIASYRRAAL